MLAVAVVLSACEPGGGANDLTGAAGGDTAAGAGRTPQPTDASGAADGEPTAGVDASPSVRPAAVALPVSCARLPLGRRAALVLVVGMPDITDPTHPLVDDLTDLGVGGVFLTGYNVASRQQVEALVAALDRGRGPAPLIATDEEWGRVSSFRDLLGATSSPRTIAATRSPAEVRTEARTLGRALADLGIDWDFAPLADLDGGPSDGVIGDRAFAATPGAAGRYAVAFSHGLRAAGVVPTVKHFPGHGAVASDVDPHSRRVPSTVNMATLRRRHLPPFRRAIAAGAPVVMMNHVSYEALDPRRPASMSPRAYRLLRSTGFDGVAITDSIGMGAVHRRWKFPAAAEQAIRAGADAVLATDGGQARRMRRRLVDAVRAGRLPEDRLNEAAGRVLRLHDDSRPCTR